MDRSTLRALGLVSGLGFAVAGPFFVFFFAGLWLDDRFGTRPLFMLLGLLFGFVAAGATIAELLKFQRTRPPRGRRPAADNNDTEER